MNVLYFFGRGKERVSIPHRVHGKRASMNGKVFSKLAWNCRAGESELNQWT